MTLFVSPLSASACADLPCPSLQMLGRAVNIVCSISPQYRQCCTGNLRTVLFPEWYREEGLWGQRTCAFNIWIGLAKLHPSSPNDTNVHSHLKGMRLPAPGTDRVPTRWAITPSRCSRGHSLRRHVYWTLASLDLRIRCCSSLCLLLLCSLAFSYSALEGLTSLLSFAALPSSVYYFLWLPSDMRHVSFFLASPSAPHENGRTWRAGVLSLNVSYTQDSRLAE